MTDTLFDIFFSGQILQGYEIEPVKRAVADIFKADDAMLDRLFSGTAVRVKAGVDQETAIKYRVTFRQAGAIVDIKPSAATQYNSASAPEQSTASGEEEDGLTLLPPKTGSLIDCAVEEEATQIGDLSYMSLAPEGTELDDTEPPPALDIDTSKLKIEH